MVPGISMPLFLGASVQGPVSTGRGVEEITLYIYRPCSQCGTDSSGIATATLVLACSEKMHPWLDDCVVVALSLLPSSLFVVVVLSRSIVKDDGVVALLSAMGRRDEPDTVKWLLSEVPSGICGCVLPRLGVLSVAWTLACFVENTDDDVPEDKDDGDPAVVVIVVVVYLFWFLLCSCCSLASKA